MLFFLEIRSCRLDRTVKRGFFAFGSTVKAKSGVYPVGYFQEPEQLFSFFSVTAT